MLTASFSDDMMFINIIKVKQKFTNMSGQEKIKLILSFLILVNHNNDKIPTLKL